LAIVKLGTLIDWLLYSPVLNLMYTLLVMLLHSLRHPLLLENMHIVDLSRMIHNLLVRHLTIKFKKLK
jgi:hypothetical protein